MHVGDLGLHLVDLAHDIAGGQGGLFRQAANLPGNHGEAAARLAGACRLDRRIERQQIRLAGDTADEIDDAVDLPRTLGQGVDLVRGLLQAAFHLGGTALQFTEVTLVVQRRSRDPLGAGAVFLQLSAEVLEGVPEMGHRVAEADQVGRYAAVIIQLALTAAIGLLCRGQRQFQCGDARRLGIAPGMQRNEFVTLA